MERVQFQLLASDGCFPIARELRQMLIEQGFSPSQLAMIEPEDLPYASLQPSLIFVLIYDEVSLLALAVERLRKRFPQSVLLFVNVFPPSVEPTNLLIAGFDDFLPFPLVADLISSRIRTNLARNHVLRHQETALAKHRLKIEVGLSDLIGGAPSFTRVLQEIVTLARTDATVLILGETGTGKDLCARAIHYAGLRAGKAFLPVNCGGIPDDLFENEFFGHERGAYTDARERYGGLIREAEGGTIFLDDIESLSSKNQAKLLRFLEGTEYMPLGSSKMRRSDVRVMASTNADLALHVSQGLFREDLYFRLAVLTLIIPPLRSRAEDVQPLAKHFAAYYSCIYNKTVTLSPTALDRLTGYAWPGNVRELENVIHRAVVHATTPVIDEIEFDSETVSAPRRKMLQGGPNSFSEAKREFVDQFEREYVERLLKDCGGNVSEAARRAGKHRRAFWEIMRKHDIHREQE
jgi:two-component system, NtrC family, response regulator GlrR